MREEEGTVKEIQIKTKKKEGNILIDNTGNLMLQGQPQHSGGALDCRSIYQAIDPAPEA